MAKSKRDKIVSLTKVKKKTKETKGSLIDEVRECVKQYKHLFVFSTENLRSTILTKVRQHFKQNSRIFYGRNNVMAVALGKSSQDELAPNLHKISQILKGPCGLMFTNEKEIRIRKYFDNFIEEDFARAGTEASMDISIPAGQITELPGSIEPQLRKLGLPTKLENGFIELLEEFVICKAGDKLSSEQTRILKHFEHKLAEFRLILLAHWTEKKGFEQLSEFNFIKQNNNGDRVDDENDDEMLEE